MQNIGGLKSVCVELRTVTVNGDAVHLAMLGEVIRNGVMLGAPVVPEGHRVLFPAEAALEFRLLHMLMQEGEQRVALHLLQVLDMGGEAGIDEAAYMLAHMVSPPVSGMILACRTEPIGGSSMKVTSVCQLLRSGLRLGPCSMTMISGCSSL